MTEQWRYEWLKKELISIRTKRFHIVAGPAGEALPIFENLKLPQSYREFVAHFGDAKLYKQKGGYGIGVLAIPTSGVGRDHEQLLCVGHFESARAYFKELDLCEGCEAPIYEWGQGGMRAVADTFERWLAMRSAAIRQRIGKKRWATILAGPKPFTEEEHKKVEARRRFKWHVLGISDSGDTRFEVRNESDMVLPYLSIGIRAGRNFEGRVWLPVSHVRPGTAAVIDKDSYKKYISPGDVEAFDLGDPEPEDREDFWEFRGMPE